MKDILRQIEHLSYGHNYKITLGIDVFENCETLEAFKTKLGEKYKDAEPENSNIIPFDLTEFWEEIEYGFAFRGDEHSGLVLNEEVNTKREKLLKEYRKIINDLITEETDIWSYSSEKGILGYPVYWDYRFILDTKRKRFLFIYGSSSD